MLTISAGHYGKGTGARGILDEGEEAVSVVLELEKKLRKKGIAVQTIIDSKSKSQQQNLQYIISQHNATNRELDVSIHFNSIEKQQREAIGTEVLYVNSAILSFAETLSGNIAKAGNLINRGAKKRSELAFLNGVTKKALLIEVCFVNSVEDARLYKLNKDQIIEAIAQTLANYFSKETPLVSSPSLQRSIEAIYSDKKAVRQQLEEGVKSGDFSAIWLENFDQGKLSLVDYLALTTVQYEKLRKKM